MFETLINNELFKTLLLSTLVRDGKSMNGGYYVEFIGPPGSGKSALQKELIKTGNFHGNPATAVQRLYGDEYPYISQFIFALPSRLRNHFQNRYLHPRYTKRAFWSFLENYPEYIEAICQSRVRCQKYKIFRLGVRAAEQYQMAKQSVRNDEIRCNDEAFYMLAASIAWRTEGHRLPDETYFETVPKPDYLIHIDTPSALCLQRQRDRGRMGIEEEWVDDIEKAQEDFRGICQRISNRAEGTGISVIKIQNQHSLKKSLSRLTTKIQKQTSICG